MRGCRLWCAVKRIKNSEEIINRRGTEACSKGMCGMPQRKQLGMLEKV